MKISVIIPCYNVEKYIDDCMNSILNQTIGLDNLEIILIDDCSTDNTVNKLKWYEEHYPDNIMLILCDKNGHQGTARNIGLTYASGDYISFVDSDDWIRKDMYEILSNIIAETNCDIVQFSYEGKYTYNDNDLPININYETFDISSIEQRRVALLDGNIYNESCTTKIYRHKIVLESGVKYAEGVSYEEPLFTYPLQFYVNKICVLNQALYYYRYNEEGTTISYMQNPSKILEHLSVQLDIFNLMKTTEFYKLYKEEIDLYFIHTYFCEQFYFLKYRGFGMPLALYKYTSKILEQSLPEWRSNKYLADPNMYENMTILKLIDELKNSPNSIAEKRINEIQEGLT